MHCHLTKASQNVDIKYGGEGGVRVGKERERAKQPLSLPLTPTERERVAGVGLRVESWKKGIYNIFTK